MLCGVLSKKVGGSIEAPVDGEPSEVPSLKGRLSKRALEESSLLVPPEAPLGRPVPDDGHVVADEASSALLR